MRILFNLFVTLVVLSFMSSCNTGNRPPKAIPVDNEPVAEFVSWEGIYAGVLPCADCTGIETIIELNEDGSFIVRTMYQEKSNDVFESKGIIEWKDGTDVIILNVEGGNNVPMQYSVEDGKLVQLDIDGNFITGDLAENYVLSKVDKNLVEKYWKLTEINGQPVIMEESVIHEPHFILKIFGNRINGNSSCNNFFGTYQVSADNKIEFSQMAATKMFCINMEIESQLFKVFEMADNYVVTDGKVLVLNNAEMESLAQFEVACFE